MSGIFDCVQAQIKRVRRKVRSCLKQIPFKYLALFLLLAVSNITAYYIYQNRGHLLNKLDALLKTSAKSDDGNMMAPLQPAINNYLKGKPAKLLQFTRGIDFASKTCNYILTRPQVKWQKGTRKPLIEIVGQPSPITDEFIKRHSIYVSDSLYSVLPERDLGIHYSSCAIVGNGPALNDGEFGRDIDSKEIVVRMNNAPANSQEKSGIRTSYRMFNKQRVPLYRDEIDRFYRETEIAGIEMEVISELTSYEYEQLEEFWGGIIIEGMKMEKFWVMSVDMQIWIFKAYRQMLANRGFRFKDFQESGLAYFPSYGLQTFLFFLKVCDEVHMYGFRKLTADPGPNPNDGKYYRVWEEHDAKSYKGWEGHNFFMERWMMEAIGLQLNKTQQRVVKFYP